MIEVVLMVERVLTVEAMFIVETLPNIKAMTVGNAKSLSLKTFLVAILT